MKRTLFSILLVLPLAVAAQKSYTITGKIPGLKEPAKVYMATVQGDGWMDTDSAEIKNGQFQFTGSLSEPTQAILSVRRSHTPQRRNVTDQLDLFIENSNITIIATDSIKNAKVSGSVIDRESREIEADIKPLLNGINELQDEFGRKNAEGAFVYPLETRKKAGDSLQKLVAGIRDVRLKFADSHPNSFMGLHTFYYYVLDGKVAPSTSEPLFNRFSAELKSSELGKKTLQKLEILKRAQTGIKATDFTQNDLNGKPFTLSSLRGKYVLVDFWASWCAPCRAENPNVVKAYNELKNKNFEIVGVSLDYPGGKAVWEEAVKKDGLPWIHVSDLKGWKNEVAVMYGVNSVPQNLLIDPQGMIVGKNLRGEALTEKLKELIK